MKVGESCTCTWCFFTIGCRCWLLLVHQQRNQSLILCLKTWSVCLRNSSPFCARVMWCPPQLMGWNITFTQAAISQFLQNSVAWIQKNFRLQKQNSNVWNLLVLFAVQNHHGPLLYTWYLKKMDPGDLVAIIAISIWWQPLTKGHAGPFEWSAWFQRFFENWSCQG